MSRFQTGTRTPILTRDLWNASARRMKKRRQVSGKDESGHLGCFNEGSFVGSDVSWIDLIEFGVFLKNVLCISGSSGGQVSQSWANQICLTLRVCPLSQL